MSNERLSKWSWMYFSGSKNSKSEPKSNRNLNQERRTRKFIYKKNINEASQQLSGHSIATTIKKIIV